MKRTQALIVVLASLTLCSSIPQEAREAAVRPDERPAETGAGSSDPRAIGCPPEHFGWILLGVLLLTPVILPVYVVYKVVGWFFKKKKSKPCCPSTKSGMPGPEAPRKAETFPPAPQHMTGLPEMGWNAA